MKPDTLHSSERLWAYLHGETGETDRLALEQEIAHDSELCGRVGEMRRFDRILKTLLPTLNADGSTADTVAEQALAAWDREHTEPDFPSMRVKPARFFYRPSFYMTGLAAAAALVLLISPVLRPRSEVGWTEPVFVPVAFRGGGTDEPVPINKESARTCQNALSAALVSTMKKRGIALPSSGLVFSFRMQALRAGAFAVSVQARLRKGEAVGEWNGDYSDIQAFLDLADASAARMVEALAHLSGAEGGGGRL